MTQYLSTFRPSGRWLKTPDEMLKIAANSFRLDTAGVEKQNNSSDLFTACALFGDSATQTVADTYVTVTNITSGSGVFLSAIAPHGYSVALKTCSIKVTIDGTVYEYAAAINSGVGEEIATLGIGAFIPGDTNSAFPFEFSADASGDALSGVTGAIPIDLASCVSPPIAFMHGSGVYFRSSLKVEAKCSLLSSTSAGDECAATYVQLT